MSYKAYILSVSFFVSSLFSLPLETEKSTTPRVHVFGDSHAHACFCADGACFSKPSKEYIFTYKDFLKVPFSIHWLGAKTMYSIGKNGLSFLNLKNYGVLEDEIVVFVFGEIDVRCHIGKQRDQKNRTLDEVLDSLVEAYINTINQNRALYKNITCIVMSVMPPTDQMYNADYPLYGSLEDRIAIAKKLNTKLRQACLQNSLQFLDIYDAYSLPNGALKPELSDKNVHVGMYCNYPIKESLLNILLKN